MVAQAVVFDIGGVLEGVADPDLVLGTKWRDRLGLSQPRLTPTLAGPPSFPCAPPAYQLAMAGIDPDRAGQVGAMSEAEVGARAAAALGLSDQQASEFMTDLWDWYRGELDAELQGLRPDAASCTANLILSNSADGARREEQRRYQFERHFDPIIYSHEVGVVKPDPAIFELACARIGAAPDEVIFVDDLAANVEAATRLGLHGILHESTQATIAAIRVLAGR